MIPWFIVDLIGCVAGGFGRDVYASATGNSWQWGADRLHLVKRPPGAPRPTRMPRCPHSRSEGWGGD